MTGIDLKALADSAQSIGILGLAILAIWAFYTRRIRTKNEFEEAEKEADKRLFDVRAIHDQRTASLHADYEAQITYVEERRADERATRLAAEQRLGSVVESIERMTDAITGIQTELVRATSGRSGGGS
jgi:hypothetical protein